MSTRPRSAAVAHEPPNDAASGRLRLAVSAGFAALLAIKLTLAATTELLVDEGFYWQCGERPALAYVDHPPLTALLVRAGTELAGHSTLGVRAPFLAIAALFPWLVFAFARPLVGRRDAWLATGATLVVPATAYLGLIAIPDVLILLWTALFLLALERATRGNQLAWPLAGLAAALGLATHYRFSVECACGLTYLLATSSGRAHWKRAGPWIAVAIACTGFAPAVILNLREDFAPLRYYLEGRHTAGVDPSGWARFVGEQLGVAGFLMLGGFGLALARVVRLARAGDDRAQLAAFFAVTPIALFFLASALESSGLPTLHWPIPGYVPLFAYLPGALAELRARGRAWQRQFPAVAHVGAAAMLLFVLNELGGPWPVTELRLRHFSGARETAAVLAPRFERDGAAQRPVLVVDNYEFGARLAFHLGTPVDLFVLDHKANRVHGRGRQYELWGMSERDLSRRAHADAWVVIERGTENSQSRWLAHVASLFESSTFESEVVLPNPRQPERPRRIRIARALGVGAGVAQ